MTRGKCVIFGVMTSVLLYAALGGIALAEEKEKDGKEKKPFSATVDKDGIQRVTVVAGSYYFDPDYIVVKVNVRVELTIRKEAGIPHSFVVQAPDAGIDLNEPLNTEPKVISFTPTKTGKYPFYCDRRFLFFKSHRDRGMEGPIEVTD